MAQPSIARRPITIEHVVMGTAKPFEDVRAAFEKRVPPLDTSGFAMLRNGEIERARQALECLPELSLFTVREHGGLLRVVGPARKAVQYEIGNPLTATRMSRHVLPACLYAPLRVVLYESEAGTAVFEYDLPSSLFGQFGDGEITAVGRALDTRLERALLAAASESGATSSS